MKVLYSLCCFICAMLYNNAAQAYILSLNSDTPCIEEPKTKPNAEPKSSYQKYAAVNFITKRNNISTDITTGDDLANNPIKETSCPSGQE
ncbi:MAG: hypothetical protein IJ545_03875, partial [Alphaproteobacteria bacterium]|nr:hypothetical protein [Alphaproteobacteria bacterium]